jgi:tetratricopeptide (TPR) repeat protein
MPSDGKRKEDKLKTKSKKQIAQVTIPQNPDGKSSGIEGVPEIREVEERLLQQLKKAVHQHEIESSMWELASFYSRTGRQEIAFHYVNQLVERMDDPGKAAGCYLAMGQLLEQVGGYEQAIEFYEQAILLEPNTKPVAYLVNNNLGYCLNYVGRYQEAEAYCRKAIAIDPERHNAYKNRGISLEGQGQFSEAAQCYIRAIQANANDPRALNHLENLIENNREIVSEINDIREQIEDCREAIKAAYDRKKKRYEDKIKCSA